MPELPADGVAGGHGEDGRGGFHPDFQVLHRDLKASTSVDATKRFLKTAQVSPFEARGQVFVVASAESLSGEAANALLKTLEEPHTSAPRHFLLLTPSRLDLLPTLRSRCLSVFLGGAGRPDAEAVGELADALAHCFRSWAEGRSAAWLLAASSVIEGAADWSEPRSGRPWALAAAAVAAARERPGVPPELSPRLLALAEGLLGAPALAPAGGAGGSHSRRPGGAAPDPSRAPARTEYAEGRGVDSRLFGGHVELRAIITSRKKRHGAPPCTPSPRSSPPPVAGRPSS